jgi:hypothetical protein
MTTSLSGTGDLATARRAFPLTCLLLAGILLGSLVAAGPAWAQAAAQPKRGGVIRIAEREAPGLDDPRLKGG